MTNTERTPGPWMHKATAGNHDFLIYPEADGRDVALVRDFNEANARLIAAAPELLAALIDLLGDQPLIDPHEGECRCCGREYGPNEGDDMGGRCDDDCPGEIARAAIAKATSR